MTDLAKKQAAARAAAEIARAKLRAKNAAEPQRDLRTEIEKLEDEAMLTLLTPAQRAEHAVAPHMIDWSGPRRKMNKAVRSQMKTGCTQKEALLVLINPPIV